MIKKPPKSFPFYGREIVDLAYKHKIDYKIVGAYCHLLTYAWDQDDGALRDDDVYLRRLLRVKSDFWKRTKTTLLKHELFVVRNGRFAPKYLPADRKKAVNRQDGKKTTETTLTEIFDCNRLKSNAITFATIGSEQSAPIQVPIFCQKNILTEIFDYNSLINNECDFEIIESTENPGTDLATRTRRVTYSIPDITTTLREREKKKEKENVKRKRNKKREREYPIDQSEQTDCFVLPAMKNKLPPNWFLPPDPKPSGQVELSSGGVEPAIVIHFPTRPVPKPACTSDSEIQADRSDHPVQDKTINAEVIDMKTKSEFSGVSAQESLPLAADAAQEPENESGRSIERFEPSKSRPGREPSVEGRSSILGPTHEVSGAFSSAGVGRLKAKFYNPLSFETPDWVDRELWEDWLVIRQKLRAVNSERALKGLLNQLIDLRKQGYDTDKLMEMSIVQSWKWPYPRDEALIRPKKQAKKARFDDDDSFYRGGI